MKKYMGPAKALKRIGSVAERHTEDHEDVAESRVAATRRAGKQAGTGTSGLR